MQERPDPGRHTPSAKADQELSSQGSSRPEQSLSQKERDSVAEHDKLSALAIYSVVLRDGEEELHRPATSLWWSGVAAGIGISASVLAEGLIRAHIGSDHPQLVLLESVGYTVGFILVIMCRLQLFTENTITVVLPLLAEPTIERAACTARLWAIVFIANMFGTFFVALITVHGGVYPPEILTAILEISHHVALLAPSEALVRGIPAGFFIAALVWMLPSSRGSEFFVIFTFTWLIAAGGFTHVIAGSNELFTLVLSGDMSFVTAISQHIAPTLLGNVLGGTGLFALLAYGQVHEEI